MRGGGYDGPRLSSLRLSWLRTTSWNVFERFSSFSRSRAFDAPVQIQKDCRG
jgi:hypothetical protein